MGVGIVCKGKKWGIVSEKGECLVPIRYDSIEAFSKTLVRAELNGWWGLIYKTTGIAALGFLYSYIGPLIDGRAEVRGPEGTFYVDAEGGIIIEITFENPKSLA